MRFRALNRILIAAFVLLYSCATTQAIDPAEIFDDPAKEERARGIFQQLRCMVCQNQSIFDSNSGLAQDLRVLVRERMETGESDEEVLDYIHKRYGDYVLLEPPMGTHTIVLWITPLLMLAIGGLFSASYFRGRRKTETASLNEEQRKAAQALLRGEET